MNHKKARTTKANKMTKGIKKVTKKGGKKQKGGLPPGSTSGDFSALLNDIVGLVESIFNTVENSVKTVVDVVELPGDIGKAYSDPGAPNPADIKLD